MELDEETEPQFHFLNDWPLRRFVLAAISLISIQICFVMMRLWGSDQTYLAIIGFVLALAFVLVPGSALLRILKMHDLGFIRSLFYSLAIGTGLLIIVGLLLNTLHYIGLMTTPLTMLPINVAYILMLGLLLLGVVKSDKEYCPTYGKYFFETPQILLYVFAALLPLMVLLSGISINTDSNYDVMVLLVAIVCGAPLVALSIKTKNYGLLVLSISVALLFHRIILTNYIIGYDVFSEYRALSYTLDAGWWDAAKNAMVSGASGNTSMSITVLGPMIQNLTSVNEIYMIKAVYPLLFAFVPLGIYSIVKEQFGNKAAFLGVCAFIGYSAFYVLMIQLVKQQMAEIFLVAFLLILTDNMLSRRSKKCFLLFFLTGIIVSHYGIGFLFLFLLGLVVALQTLSHLIKSWKERNGAGHISILSWTKRTINTWIHEQTSTKLIGVEVVIFAFAIFFLYYAFIGSGMILPAVGIGTAEADKTSISKLTLQGMDALEYLFINYGSAINNIEKYVVFSVQTLMVIGLYFAMKGKKLGRKVNDDYCYFALAAAVLLGMSYAVPGISASLYFGRMFTFIFVFICGFFVLGVFGLLDTIRYVFSKTHRDQKARPMERDRITMIVSTFIIILLLMTSTGLLSKAAGTFEGSYALDSSTSGPYYSDSDVAGALWVSNGEHIGPYTVVADWHRFPIFGGLGVPVDDLTYQMYANDTDSFIYLSEWNNEYDYVYSLNTGNYTSLTYTPFSNLTRQFNNNYDIVYSTSTKTTIIYIPSESEQNVTTNEEGPAMYKYETTPLYVFAAIGIGLLSLGLLSLYTTYAHLGGRNKRDDHQK